MEPLLQIEDLVTHFGTRRGTVRAVDGVSLTLRAGESLGIVGESGSGKSALGKSIMRLIEPPGRIVGGRVMFDGKDLLQLAPEAMRRIRGPGMTMIFQDPMATLNPVKTIGCQIAEMLEVHTHLSRSEIRHKVIETLEQVGIPNPEQRYGSYPHEFSGGMQQRVVIACSLIMNPRLIIADEPTTALDVTVQAQILFLLKQLQKGASNTASILVSHDLGVVAQLCDRVCVMYAGSIVEVAPIDDILNRPRHPYTAALMDSIPQLDGDQGELATIPGTIADAIDMPAGCKFHPRCSKAADRCRMQRPVLTTQGDGNGVACHLYN